MRVDHKYFLMPSYAQNKNHMWFKVIPLKKTKRNVYSIMYSKMNMIMHRSKSHKYLCCKFDKDYVRSLSRVNKVGVYYSEMNKRKTINIKSCHH